jgi:hypothetical protein
LEFNISISQTKVCGYKNNYSDTPSVGRGTEGGEVLCVRIRVLPLSVTVGDRGTTPVPARRN